MTVHPVLTFAALHDVAAAQDRRALVVAGALSDSALRAVDRAAERGLVTPHLVGPAAAIRERIDALGLSSLGNAAISDASDADAAVRSVALVREGGGELLLKGSVRTDALLQAVLDRRTGLRAHGEALLSDVLFYEDRFSAQPRLVGITDGGINVLPSAAALRRILHNGILVLQALGRTRPQVALLSATEAVSGALPSTVVARELQEAAERGEFGGCTVAGPLALDSVLLAASARAKGISTAVAGQADLMVVPNIEAGNILGKAVKYLYGSITAHVIVGARAPVLIPSRVESAADKLASIALGSAVADALREGDSA
jgi:phosphate butyryltransferase